MLFVISLLFYIIKKPIGEVSYLPKLENDEQLSSFIDSHKTCVIIFLAENKTFSELDFANYAISEYKDKISFALAIPQLTKSLSYSGNHPVLMGYISGKPVYYNGDSSTVFFEPTVFNTISFCKYLLGGRTKKLTSPEEIRRILEGHEVAVIGVDRAPKPKNFPKNEIFYETLAPIFRHFNINVSAGIYVFRPSDRQLIRVNNKNYKTYTKSYLTDISYIIENNISQLTDRKYVAGYFMSPNNESLANKQIQILNQLARTEKYKNQFYFSPIPKSKDNLISKVGRFSYFNSPYFIVIGTKFLVDNLNEGIEFSKNAKRWIINDPVEMYNFDFISKFIDNILENENKPTIISEEIPKNENLPYSILSSMKTNYNEFDKIIESNRNEGKDCFIIFINEDHKNFIKILLTIKKVDDMLKDQKVKFLFFDVSKNDLPEIIFNSQRNNENIELPFMVRFSAKEKISADNLLFYQSSFDFSEIMNWVSFHSSTKFALPKFNETLINDEIFKQIPKKNKTLNFPKTDQFSSKEEKAEL